MKCEKRQTHIFNIRFNPMNCWRIYKGVISHIESTTLFAITVPSGPYCYGKGRHDKCPFWELNPNKPSQMNGYCRYLNRADWVSSYSDGGSTGLLWDQCKECDINDYDGY